jgi:membrane protein implicated in regulation of membrane protease activity
MAEQGQAGPVVPVGPTGEPAAPPKVLPWLVVHTVGRLAIFALVAVVLMIAGLDFWSSLLFGLLLSMPLAYLALRRSRERLSEALVVRQEQRKRDKEQLRARLAGEGTTEQP